jgi:hypothetical protein
MVKSPQMVDLTILEVQLTIPPTSRASSLASETIGGYMYKISGKIGLFIAITALLITSCAVPQVTLPTPDLNLVRTEAVVTAMAQMTKQAALIPTATKTKIVTTAEPLTTSTPIVITATPSIYGSSGSSGGSSGGSSSGVKSPTGTPVVYGAAFITQDPLDGYPCPTGEQLDFKITFLNTGAATWDHLSYYYKLLYNSGPEQLTRNNQYFIPKDVPSGSKVTLILDIQCPRYASPTAWTTQWGLVNNNGQIFAKFYFRFYTVTHVVPTPTKTPTQSPG